MAAVHDHPREDGALPCFDLFNGDADGLCALHQLRMHQPRESTLVTGVKRDIELLRRLPRGLALEVNVLDICFDRNVDQVREVVRYAGRTGTADETDTKGENPL